MLIGPGLEDTVAEPMRPSIIAQARDPAMKHTGSSRHVGHAYHTLVKMLNAVPELHLGCRSLDVDKSCLLANPSIASSTRGCGTAGIEAEPKVAGILERVQGSWKYF